MDNAAISTLLSDYGSISGTSVLELMCCPAATIGREVAQKMDNFIVQCGLVIERL